MVSAIAAVAAVFGFLAAYAEVRRRLTTKARINRRLSPERASMTVKHFCFHAPSILPWMGEDVDLA
jgi:hypothetical protein